MNILLHQETPMNIQRTGILASPLKTNFKAQTKITAPEELLCPEDIDYFEKLGSRIGPDKDVIEITIDDVHTTKYDPSVEIYTVTKKYLINQPDRASAVINTIEIPYIKDGQIIENNSPYNYILRAFEKLHRKYWGN